MAASRTLKINRLQPPRSFPVLTLLLVLCLTFGPGHQLRAYAGCYDEESLTYDLAQRDRLSQSPESGYSKSSSTWGPHPRAYPPVVVPPGCNPVKWQRLRVVAVARRYLGLPYRHHHIPGWQSPDGKGPGLDCSNFTAWVYNFGLGRQINSNVRKQADGPAAPGRRLRPEEPLEPGDLLFIMKQDRSRVSHVAIYLDADRLIDDHKDGVQVRPFKGWYKTHFSHARRLLE